MIIPCYSWPETLLSWSSVAGNNEKNILVLLPQGDLATSLPYLQKVLSAARIDLEKDTHYLGIDPASAFVLFSQPDINRYRYIFLIGIQPETAGLSIPSASPYLLLEYETVTCIVTPALQEIAHQPKEKKAILFQIFKDVFLSKTSH